MAVDRIDAYSVAPVWVLVTAGAVLIMFLAPAEEHYLWLSVTLAAGTILTFCVQLALDRKEGLVNRMMASLGGAVVILVVATAITAIIGAS